MKPFLAIASARFRLLLQYRAAAFAGLFTQIFFGVFLVAVMSAFYKSSGKSQPLALQEIITYIWLGQAFFSLLPLRVDPEVKSLVTTGGIAYELLRPVNLYSWWLARAVALKSAPVVMKAVPMFVLAGTFLGLRFPATLESALLWMISIPAAMVLASAIVVLMNVSLLWTLSAEGAQYLIPVLAMLLSGISLPLPLFPDWTHWIISMLPFRGLIDTPNRIWLGEFSGADALLGILHQLVWSAILIAAGILFMSRGLRRVVIQGG